ncbi:aspartate aminotransferase family protein, partial [Streptomyces sp. NPDC059525]
QVAAAVLEVVRAGGLLVGKGGGHDTSVLRIAPPLSLTVAEAEEGAEILGQALRSIE